MIRHEREPLRRHAMCKACLFYFANNWQSHTLHFYIISIVCYWKCMRWQKWRSVAKRDNQWDAVKRTMLDLYCRQSLCCNSIQTSTCLDPICILMHVKLFFCTMCEDNGLCHSANSQGFMLQALIFQNIDRYNHFEINLWYIVLLRKKTEHPISLKDVSVIERTTSDEDIVLVQL